MLAPLTLEIVMGWIGNVFIVVGAWNVGHKRRWAFLLSMIGGCCWIAEGTRIGRLDLIAIESLMFLMALRNFIKWGTDYD